MGLFSRILEKLGLKKEEEEQQAPSARTAPRPAPSAPPAARPASPPAVKPATQAPRPATSAAPGARPPTPTGAAGGAPQKAAPAAPKPVSEVDVVKQLEALSTGKNLNWKNSIVDLLKLLDLDSSYEARVELAKELDCPPDMMTDSARMNTWLHKTVLRKIAENGGNIPADLLD